ncbi:MAG TPA: DHH family phosphoesterase [Thermoanaerobaculia bacterium]|nr:DHH family phosphoesterase [Thermoanaerobaculia bacterium]
MTDFAAFVNALPRQARVLVFHDSDADGVTAGVVLQRTLERIGFSNAMRGMPGRERDAWSEGNRAIIAEAQPQALFVLDLGSRNEPLCDGIPTCLIDHHRPDGVPPGALLVTAYDRDPIPNTSLLVYELCAPLADIEDLDWIAAIGALSDVGERAPFPLLASVKKRYAMSDLKEATALVNAARRAAGYRPEVAARALLDHASPRDFVRSTSPEVAALRAAREEVKIAMAEAKKAAPKFAGNVALIRVRSRCQVHPVVAQIWRTRLPKYIVIVANDGYLPGRVNFSARGTGGASLDRLPPRERRGRARPRSGHRRQRDVRRVEGAAGQAGIRAVRLRMASLATAEYWSGDFRMRTTATRRRSRQPRSFRCSRNSPSPPTLRSIPPRTRDDAWRDTERHAVTMTQCSGEAPLPPLPPRWPCRC